MLEKPQQSGVQPSWRLASLDVIGDQLRATLKPRELQGRMVPRFEGPPSFRATFEGHATLEQSTLRKLCFHFLSH